MKLKNHLVIFLLFPIFVGIIAPSLTVFQDSPIEETISLMNSEWDNESEEMEINYVFNSIEISFQPNSPISKTDIWWQNSYRFLFLKLIGIPPQEPSLGTCFFFTTQSPLWGPNTFTIEKFIYTFKR